MDIVDRILRGKEKEPCFANKNLVRGYGADSMVLLKNDGVLPISVETTGRIALFGAGAVDTIFCGTYSNYVYSPVTVNVMDGLLSGGFTFSSEVWLSKMKKAVVRAEKECIGTEATIKRLAGAYKHANEVAISDADLAESRLKTDICIYVLRRVPTYEETRNYTGGDYLLSDVESENIRKITESFSKVILVLNSGIVELGALAKSKSIKAIILMGAPGMEAGNSLCDVLTGEVNPSGRLSDTWAKKYKDYPACSNFSKKNRNSLELDYKEGIYIGYRYFDSFGVKPLYPFGYGLSYTNFELKPTYLEANWFYITLKVRVTNIGKVPGKEVVQVYVSNASGRLEKPYQELKGFGKTKLLESEESEELTIKIDTNELASFSEKKSAWIMEGGEYIFRVGENSRNTSIAAKVVLNKQTIIKTVANVIAPKVELEFMEPVRPEKEETGYILTAALNSDDLRAHNKPVKKLNVITTYLHEGSIYSSYVNNAKFEIPFRCTEKLEYVRPISSHSFIDVVAGRVSMEEFVASLSPEVLARLCCGAWDESKKQTDSRVKFKIKPKKEVTFAGRTTNQYLTTLGIPGVSFLDGPSGLHLPGINATCYPAPINMAQTWDVEAMEEVGKCYGTEMEYFGIDYCLAPAINIHRDPMVGRALNYYSEDPVLTGNLAASFIRGVQSHEGRGVVVKHYAVYSARRKNHVVNCNISRRALREIYLKAFEICVKDASPKGIMNSNNKINGDFASTWRSLNLDILRGEWGFNGFVLSEWGTESEKAYDIHGGCDLIMPGFNPDKLLHAMTHVDPVFTADGYVEEVKKTTPFGKPLIMYDSWGSFLPNKNGSDVVVTTVAPNVPLNPRIEELEAEKIASITIERNGSKTIRYKGINRGAFLALGDLQLAAMHILGTIKDSATMLELMEQSKM